MAKRPPKIPTELSLERLIFSQGFGSRHECKGLCLHGAVAVEGKVIDDPDAMIPVHEGLMFSVEGKAWPYHAQAYIALNKPAGYECSHKTIHHPSVYTLLPSALRVREVQAAGRLDADTTGLLLFSDDGQFIHRATSGKRNLPKTYLITTKHPVGEDIQTKLLTGVQLDDEPSPISAAACEIVNTHQLSMTITTGKYHQVKRMVAAAGNRVTELHRHTVGKLELPAHLKSGEWIWITPEQVF